MAKLAPETTTLIHKHARVTPGAVLEFGDASHGTQLDVLSVLRGRVHDQSSAVEVALGAAAIAFISVFLTPVAVPDTAPYISRIVIGIFIGAGAAAVLLPVFIGPYLRASRQAVAATWLAAYEDELTRRWMQKGVRARRWQRARSK